MALTVADIETGIQARGYEADTAAQQLALINQVQRRFFGANRWEIARVTATASVTAGTASFALPADVLHVESVRLRVGVTNAPIEWAPRQEVLDLLAQGGSTPPRATPYLWTLGDPGTIKLYPTPSAAGTATVTYFKTCPILTTGTDVPMMPEPYVDILIVGVCELMAQRERQWDAARAFKAERQEIERQARAQLGIVQQQGASVVTQSGFYGPVGIY